MTRKQDADAWALRRPFLPFEIRLNDGQRFRFTSMEQMVVGRSEVAALIPSGAIVQLSIGLISTIRPLRLRKKA